MSEPTKEAMIDEIVMRAEQEDYTAMKSAILDLCHYECKQAREDALEEVAVVCDELESFWNEATRPDRARLYAALAKSIRAGWHDTKDIRTLKTQGDAQ